MIDPRYRNYGLSLLIALFSFGTSSLLAQCSAIINTYPYRESFETGTANWVSLGTNNDWAWGSPTKPTINAAGDGTKCWIAGGLTASFYNYGEKSWVQSPCFDLTTIDKPFISFILFWDTEYIYDGVNIQYSVNGGASWTTIGSSSESATCNADNWYNTSSITNLNGLVNQTSGWSGTTQASSGSCRGGHGIGRWVRASHCVPGAANQPQVIFRFTLGSGTTCNDYDGFAFDDFIVSTAPTTNFSIDYTCQGNSSLQFNIINGNCLDTYSWNFGDANSSNNSSTQQSDTHQFSTAGTYNITLSASGICSKDTMVSRQINIMTATISTTDVSCVGDSDGTASVTITGGTALTSIQWNVLPVMSTPIIGNLSVGSYTATVSDPNLCGVTLSASIVESPNSRPTIDIGSDTTLCPGSFFTINPPSFSSYLWQDGSTDSSFTVISKGPITLSIINSNGCVASDSFYVKEDCLDDILFPNTFTPNDDGINELFSGIGSVPSSFLLSIYNRWGELIFQTENYLEGWNGTYKGHHAEVGLYIFQSVYSISNSNQKEKAGSLYLIK